jgi:hypothetical protein
MYRPFRPSTIRTSPLEHFGLITTRALLAGGLTHSAISRRVKRGALIRRYPGVYSLSPGELARDAASMAAVLACGDGAVLAHLSVAEFWDCSRWFVPEPHVLVARRHRPVEGIVVHHARRLDARDVTVHRGVPVTTVARMLIDLSDDLTAYQLANVIHRAAYRKRFSVDAARRAIERGNGRHRLDVVKQAIELHLAGSAGTRSALEDEVLALTAGLPEPLVNMACEGEEVDFHWPARRLVAEVDGPGHLRPAARRNDARRDAKLRAAGYAVLRFTDVQIRAAPGSVRSALRERL